MSLAAVTLEQFANPSLFGDVGGAENAGVDPKEAYLEGFAAGEAAALARFAEAERAFADAAQSLDETLQALKPASERALAEALETVLSALLPMMTQRGFATEAASVIARAFAGSSPATVTITAPPAQIEALAAALSAMPGALVFEMQADESAPAASARVVCGKGGLDFDLTAATEACLAALNAACGPLRSGF